MRIAFTNTTLWPGDGRASVAHPVASDGRIETAIARPYTRPDTNRLFEPVGTTLSPGPTDVMLLGGFGCRVSAEGPRTFAGEIVRIGGASVQFCGGSIGRDGNFHCARRIREAMRDAGSLDAARVIGWY